MIENSLSKFLSKLKPMKCIVKYENRATTDKGIVDNVLSGIFDKLYRICRLGRNNKWPLGPSLMYK